MNSLSAFLHPVEGQEEQEVVVSRRFLGEDGKPVPFRIRALTQAENEDIVKKCTRVYRDKTGQKVSDFDRARYSRALVVAATVEPDFRASELCQHFGVLDPEMVPSKMLYAGEYQKLSEAIAKLSGIGDEADADEDEAVKN